MAQQRKSAEDYGQLSLFEEVVPEWLQPVEPQPSPVTIEINEVPTTKNDDDDDLSLFNQWLQKNRQADTQDE